MKAKYTVIPTDDFTKELKRIAKKHRGILSDIAELSAQLKEDPTMGSDLGQNIYKIRLAISGTNIGKSGGARVITCVVLVREIIYLSEIYLKNEDDTVDVNIVVKHLKGNGLI